MIYAGGRNKLRRFLNINENSRGLSNAVDLAYGGFFNGFIQPAFYFAEAVIFGNDIDTEILYRQIKMGLSLGSLAGIFVGAGIDVFADFYNCRPSKRIPQRIRNLPGSLKASLATLLTAGSLVFSMNYLPKIIPDSGNYGKEPSISYAIMEKICHENLSLQENLKRARSSLECKLRINKE